MHKEDKRRCALEDSLSFSMLSMSSVVRKKLVSINRLLAASEKKVGEVNLGFLVVFSFTSLCEYRYLNHRGHRGAARFTEKLNAQRD